MKEKLRRLSNHHHTRTTIKYGIVSVIATIIDFVVLNGGIKLAHLAPQVAKTFAFLAATIAVFRLQQQWVFRADPGASTTKQLVQYLGASVLGFLASQVSITISNHIWPSNLLYINIANFVGFGSVWLGKLVYFRFVVFKPATPSGDESSEEPALEKDPAAVSGDKATSGGRGIEHERGSLEEASYRGALGSVAGQRPSTL
jgi:putative flippase GtrA